MADVFLSYAQPDRAIARRLAEVLHTEEGWDVFWDRTIRAGAEWNEELQRELRSARCVVVLWSRASTRSFWVRGEAVDAFERDAYVPVQLDDAPLPQLFRHAQAQSVRRWAAGHGDEEIDQLRATLRAQIDALPMHGNLESVEPRAPVTSSHLHLIHSSWRVPDRDAEFGGRRMYRIHLLLFGHDSALARVGSVVYHLPGYPEGHTRQDGGPPERLFELKELANGFSIAQADVSIRDQPPGHPKVVRLSRFLNLSEAGPRLDRQFIARSRGRSSLSAKLSSLESTRELATEMLASMDADRALARLLAQGVPPVMAEAAVRDAAGALRRHRET